MKDSLLEWSQISLGGGERVFMDGDDGAVLAKEQPGPDSGAMREDAICLATMSILCAVQRVVSDANVVASEVDGGIMP